MQVSPFRYLRIDGYLLLPAAFRSLSRLSSALSAKASTLRAFLLDLCSVSIALETFGSQSKIAFRSFEHFSVCYIVTIEQVQLSCILGCLD